MLQSFTAQFGNQLPTLRGKRVLLACSGGLDSCVLLHLMRQLDCELSIAHVNYNLRGAESIEDADFVKQLAASNDLQFHLKEIAPGFFQDSAEGSLQMLARKLRYQWFAELCEQYDYHYVLTAHQADDALETMLMNLARGSGIKGLMSIPTINGNILRPLLNYDRQQLKAYAIQQGLKWREDSSNAKTDYTRNALRHKVIPELQKIFPKIVKKARESQLHLADSNELLSDYIQGLEDRVWFKTPAGITIEIEKLSTLSNPEAVLYELLARFEFTDWKAISELYKAESGRSIYSKGFRLTKDRSQLLVSPLQDQKSTFYTIQDLTDCADLPIRLKFEEVSSLEHTDAKVITVDKEQLELPLELRRWQEGDRFVPFGMKGTKKLSDYLIDQKISVVEKEKIWLLCSGSEIVWVVGHRADDRFKVSQNTKKLLRITWVD